MHILQLLNWYFFTVASFVSCETSYLDPRKENPHMIAATANQITSMFAIVSHM